MIVFCRVFLLPIILCIVMQSSFSQDLNSMSVENSGREILLGKITKEGLQSNSFASWFSPNYKMYEVDNTKLKRIKRKLKKYKIQVFLGTWCGDSKREIPRFFKLLNTIDFPEEKLEMIALNHTKKQYKKSPTGEEKGLNIIKVPTFIFYKDGKEVNRIVESPVESLEKDIVSILKGNYVSNYSLD